MTSELSPVESQSMAGLSGLFWHLQQQWFRIACGCAAGATLAAGLALVIPPVFTAKTTIIPPQQQGGVSSALGSLGALAGLAGGLAGVKTSADQYLSLMESATVVNTIIDKFDLVNVYDVKYKIDAQKELANRSRLAVGKKDGLISVEVDDKDPRRAAEIANMYVEQLRLVNASLAVSEAQQRRVFFEHQLKDVKEKLTKAQVALQSSGISPNALKAEPRSAADGYAKIKTELMAAEIRLNSTEQSLVGNAPELLQQRSIVAKLKAELDRLERVDTQPASSDYISKYREYKYQESLFDFFAKQYESARVDESREGSLIQVVDFATVPERKSKPKLGLLIVGGGVAGALLTTIWLILVDSRRKFIAVR